MPTFRSLRASVLTCVCAMSAAGAAAGQVKSAPPPMDIGMAGGPAKADTGVAVVDLGMGAADALRGGGGGGVGGGGGGKATATLRLDNVPIAGLKRSLVLERFEVFSPDAQVVVARGKGWERIPTPDVAFWRGTVEGEDGSSVFIAAGSGVTVGSIDFGAGGERLAISSRLTKGHDLPPGSLAIFKKGEGAGAGARVGPQGPGTVCGLDTSGLVLAGDGHEHGQADGGEGDGGTAVPRRLRVQLAVDTDFEFYSLFNDATDAAEYVAMLYGEVSAVFLREIKVGVELSFVRIWDTPTDPWDVSGDDLLPWFRQRWNADMGGVTRDLAQLCSGRRDLPWGGIAYLNGVCNNSSYSCVGYILGYFPDPSTPNSEGYDIMVTAHEIGHNFAAGHTHDYGIDGCQNIDTPARRGSIMSYCSQTVSGGNAVMDLRFETNIRTIMRNYLRQRSCVDRDCNGNSVPDSQDISSGTSLDTNGNSVPDECEDCNGNGRFDVLDIQQGFSLDRNSNGIPDDCEPDCNGNGVVDEIDISLGTSLDTYRDGVPDECQADCDDNGTADYNQIQADMTLDIDRNRVLDGCQDCDNDGTNDLFALDGSRNLWISSSEHGEVLEFYATTGVRFRDGHAKGMIAGQDVLITPDRRVLVSSGEDDRIVEFDRTGAYVGDLVSSGGGGLDFPAGMAISKDGTLLVVSRENGSVREYNLTTGAFIRALVSGGGGGAGALIEPFAIVVLPTGGDVLVSSDDGSVRRFNGTTGAFSGTVVTAGSGGLDTPRGMLVTPDYTLLVTSLMTDQVLHYNLPNGAFIGQWNRNGTNSVLRLLGPWGIVYGPDGNVYVAVNGNQGPAEFDPPPFLHDPLDPPELHVTNTKVFRFDVRNGNFLTSFVIGQDTGLEHAAGLAFMPLGELDCNANQLPDSCDIAQGIAGDCNENGVPDSCDIAGGVETDYNGNGVPDACECLADWNHDGVVNSTDVSDFINDWFEDQAAGTVITDFNNDGVSNSTDVSDFINAYFDAAGTC